MACGSSAGPGSSTVYIEVDAGGSSFYLSSDNLDAASFTDSASSHKVSALPDGSVTVCKFTVSQGVNYSVWSTGSPASTDLARAYCQSKGQ